MELAATGFLLTSPQQNNYSLRSPPRQRKLLPSRSLLGARLPLYLDADLFTFGHFKPRPPSACASTSHPLLRRVISPRPRRNLRNVHRLIRQLHIVVHLFRARGLEPLAVIPFRKIRLIVRAPRF